MDLERIYYTFTIQQGLELVVEVTDGDTVEYGSRALPFVADGELPVGASLQFDETFVLHVPGRSTVDVQVAPPPELPPPTEPTAPDPIVPFDPNPTPPADPPADE